MSDIQLDDNTLNNSEEGISTDQTNEAGDQFTSGNPDSRSPLEKRGGTNPDEYSRGEGSQGFE